jgi:hypothetical protein
MLIPFGQSLNILLRNNLFREAMTFEHLKKLVLTLIRQADATKPTCTASFSPSRQ